MPAAPQVQSLHVWPRNHLAVTPWLPVLARVDISALAPPQVFAFLTRHAWSSLPVTAFLHWLQGTCPCMCLQTNTLVLLDQHACTVGFIFSSFFLWSVVFKPRWMLSLLSNACWHWRRLSQVRRLSAGERLPKAASSAMPAFPQLWSTVVRGASRREENGVGSCPLGQDHGGLYDNGRGGNGGLWSCLFKWY